MTCLLFIAAAEVESMSESHIGGWTIFFAIIAHNISAWWPSLGGLLQVKEGHQAETFVQYCCLDIIGKHIYIYSPCRHQCDSILSVLCHNYE